MSPKPSLKGNSHLLEEMWTSIGTEICRAVSTEKCIRRRKTSLAIAQKPLGETVGASELGAGKGVLKALG